MFVMIDKLALCVRGFDFLEYRDEMGKTLPYPLHKSSAGGNVGQFIKMSSNVCRYLLTFL